MNGLANPNQIKQSKALLSLHITSNVGTLTISNQIPQQALKLCQYRIEMDTDADAVTQKILYFDCNLFNNVAITSDRLNFYGIPICLDDIAVTVAHPEFAVSMSQIAQQNMSYSIRSHDGTLVSGFISLSLTFEYDYIST